MGAQVAKKSVTIPADLIDQAEEFMGPGDSFSSYLAESLRLRIEHDRLAALSAELETANGPADPVEVSRWREVLRAPR